jgi:hypothetical protein
MATQSPQSTATKVGKMAVLLGFTLYSMDYTLARAPTGTALERRAETPDMPYLQFMETLRQDICDYKRAKQIIHFLYTIAMSNDVIQYLCSALEMLDNELRDYGDREIRQFEEWVSKQ